MINALKIPISLDEPTVVVELDDEKQPNPYFLAKEVLGDWVEKVRIDPKGVLHMFVDESGQLKRLPLNQRASLFYSGAIAGDVLIMHLETEWTEDGPGDAPHDMSQEDMKRVMQVLHKGLKRLN